MMTTTVTEKPKRAFDNYAIWQQQRAMMALERIGVTIVSKTKDKLKWRTKKGKGFGGRASGARLANSYTHVLEREGSDITLTVGTGVKYAKYVEGWPVAPRRRFLPFSVAPDFRVWLERHGVKVPETAKGWMTGGEDSTTPHLGPAAQEVLPNAIPKLIEMSRR